MKDWGKSEIVLLSESEGHYILTETKTLAGKQGLFKVFFRVPRRKVWWLKSIMKSHTTGGTPVILGMKENKGYISDTITDASMVFPNLFLTHKCEIGLLTTGKRADSATTVTIEVEVFDSRKFLFATESIPALRTLE